MIFHKNYDHSSRCALHLVEDCWGCLRLPKTCSCGQPATCVATSTIDGQRGYLMRAACTPCGQRQASSKVRVSYL